MTKKIRIENADCSDYNVSIKIQLFNYDTKTWEDSPERFSINYPTALAEVILWEGKRIIIEENGVSEYSWRKKDSV